MQENSKAGAPRGDLKFLPPGFTAMEALVVLAVITAISILVLANFRGLKTDIALERSTRELALAFRRAQSTALAVRQVNTSLGPVVPRAVGLFLATASPDRYVRFTDNNNNKRYDPGTDGEIGSDAKFEPGVQMSSLSSFDASGNPVPQAVVYVIFLGPDAAAGLYNASGPIGDSILIQLNAAIGGGTKKVRVRTSGQISVE